MPWPPGSTTGRSRPDPPSVLEEPLVRRRVAITGMGVIAPGGVGAKEFWTLLTEGRTATRRISFFDPSPFRSQVAAEVDFDPVAAGLTPAEVARMDRAAQFAVVATREAVADSGIELPAGWTSGLDSVGYAVELIRERSADIMIAGSTDAPISPITLACFDAIKATTPRNDDAEHASRPFDISRDGFVLGEGAAMF